LRKGGVEDPEFLREGVRVLAQGLMELEVAEKIRAERYERSDERTTYRNGYRDRALSKSSEMLPTLSMGCR
jgi:transposase-like protein